jgi:putative transcriptional regulator
MTTKRTYKSEAFEAIHETALAFYRAGTIDEATMRDFDRSCLAAGVGSKLNDIEQLQEAVRVGDESGPSIPAAEVFTDLRQVISRRRATQNPTGPATQVGGENN